MEKFYEMICNDSTFKVFDAHKKPGDTEMWGKAVVTNSLGQKFLLLGCQYSYWGSISYHIVKALYEHGASEVIYAAKLGTFSQNRFHVAVPSGFCFTPGIKVETTNRLASHFQTEISYGDLLSGFHVSVPTVVEETQNLLKLVERTMRPQTIDNEISHMARACSDFNESTRSSPPAQFGCIHFTTDCLKTVEEVMKNDPYQIIGASDYSSTESNPVQKCIVSIGIKLLSYMKTCQPSGILRSSTSCGTVPQPPQINSPPHQPVLSPGPSTAAPLPVMTELPQEPAGKRVLMQMEDAIVEVIEPNELFSNMVGVFTHNQREKLEAIKLRGDRAKQFHEALCTRYSDNSFQLFIFALRRKNWTELAKELETRWNRAKN